jgi:ParB family chromosome partitioning protein
MIDLEDQDIATRRKAIQEAIKTWTPEQKAQAGVIVTIGRDGAAEVMRGLVRDEDRRAIAATVRQKGSTEHRGGDDTHDEDEGSPSLPAVPERRSPGCSEALTKRLAAHRTMALQAMLAQNAAVALASVVHVFVLRTFGADYPREASALQVSPQLSAYALEAAADDLKASRALQAVQETKEAWRARLPDDQGEWLGWLIGLPQAELIELLALCGALTVNALPGAGAAGSANAIASALGLDMADWWEPTAQAYLNHVPKAQIIAALKEAGPQLAGGGVEAMKKDALVSAAASRLAGTRWLPEPLRRSPG